MTSADDKSGRVRAALLSLPSIVALTLFGVGTIVEALGYRAFGNNPAVGGVVLITFILIPLATVILVGWAIARWANHGAVPGWLLAATAGNGVAFWIFYQMTRI